jgi:VWFA-related protein
MTLTRIRSTLALGLALASASIFSSIAGAQATADLAPSRITVTAVAKEKNTEAPPLSKEDFLVYEGKDRRPVLSATRQDGDNNKLDLYILVDDSIDNTVALNFKDIGGFVRELPTPARVGVLYLRNGTVQVLRDLTDDREAAIKSLRLPLGNGGVAGGLFLSLQDLAKRLPEIPGRRYAILLLSSGIDTFRGLGSTTPGANPDFQNAVNRLNRTGVTVYSIYVSPSAHFARSLFLVGNGQNCLSQLSDETGGEAYFQGFGTPISMKPFLDEAQKHLANQYLVAFTPKPRKKAGYSNIKVTTEQSGVELDGPGQVYVTVPGDKK